MLFNDIAVSATMFHKELKATQKERMEKVAEAVKNCKKAECDVSQKSLFDAV